MAYIKEWTSKDTHTYELNIRSRFRAIYQCNSLWVRIPRHRLPLWSYSQPAPSCGFHFKYKASHPMRPKARGLTQHGGRPGWLEKSDPGRCDFGRDRLPFPYRTGCPNRSCPQLRADGISSCYYIINVHNQASWATSRKEGMAWYSIVGPCLLSVPTLPFPLLVIGQLWKMACLRGPTRFHIHTQLNLQLENKCRVQILMQHIGLCP